MRAAGEGCVATAEQIHRECQAADQAQLNMNRRDRPAGCATQEPLSCHDATRLQPFRLKRAFRKRLRSLSGTCLTPAPGNLASIANNGSSFQRLTDRPFRTGRFGGRADLVRPEIRMPRACISRRAFRISWTSSAVRRGAIWT